MDGQLITGAVNLNNTTNSSMTFLGAIIIVAIVLFFIWKKFRSK